MNYSINENPKLSELKVNDTLITPLNYRGLYIDKIVVKTVKITKTGRVSINNADARNPNQKFWKY